MCKHLYNRDTQHSLQGHQGPSSNTGILKSIRAHDSSSERLNLTVTGLRRRGLKVIPRSHVYPLKRRKARKQRAQVTLTNYVSEWILKDMAVIPRKQKHSKVVCSFASELDTAQRGDSLPWLEDYVAVQSILSATALIHSTSFLSCCLLTLLMHFCHKIWGFPEPADFIIVHLGGVRLSSKVNISRMTYPDGSDALHYFLLTMEINFNLLLASAGLSWQQGN